MQRSFDQEFDALKTLILGMGSRVESAIDFAIQGLVNRDPVSFEEVHILEKQINHAHIKVDEDCLSLLARQSPVASDLRFVFSVVKLNADLERMGDQAVNIAYNGAHYISKPPIKPLIDLPKMAEESRHMVRMALKAFVDSDMELANKVLEHDTIVDDFKRKITEELIEYMTRDPSNLRQAMNLILIARNLERLADHATNIAEEAIFIISGHDIRHGNQFKP
jgi:phosphate transport system protein